MCGARPATTGLSTVSEFRAASESEKHKGIGMSWLLKRFDIRTNLHTPITRFVYLAVALVSARVGAKVICACATNGVPNYGLTQSCCTSTGGQNLDTELCNVGNIGVEATHFEQCCVSGGWGASCETA
ncbi:hypothetical protein C8R47DRAFT_1074324 [Mycena vitilis]|nr:hypothetical protein C8R47DRAFT_1074324 [Mycena vitilis]